MSVAGNAGAGAGLFPVLAAILDADRVLVDDTCGLDRDDMYVTVESGVTWQALHDALREINPRTPYRGLFSGGRRRT